MADLSALKQRRNGYRLNARKAKTSAENLLLSDIAADYDELEKLLDKLIMYSETIDGLNQKIFRTPDQAAKDKEMKEQEDLENQLPELITDLKSLGKRIQRKVQADKEKETLSQLEEARNNLERQKFEREEARAEKEEADRQTQLSYERRKLEFEKERIELEKSEIERRKRKEESKKSNLKLTKLTFEKFDGDVMQWRSFYDSFVKAIGDNDEYSEVDKLNYLQNQVTNSAKALISPLELTATNFPVAVKMLKDRFGGDEAAISAHHKALLSIPPATNNTAKLRSTYDAIQNHMLSLEALGEDSEQPIYVSMICDKLQHELMLQLELRN